MQVVKRYIAKPYRLDIIPSIMDNKAIKLPVLWGYVIYDTMNKCVVDELGNEISEKNFDLNDHKKEFMIFESKLRMMADEIIIIEKCTQLNYEYNEYLLELYLYNKPKLIQFIIRLICRIKWIRRYY